VRRNSHYPFISPSLTNPWKEIYATSKHDNSFLPATIPVLTKNTHDNFAENVLDSDTENECCQKQKELIDVLKKVRFLVVFFFFLYF
jgi:hypothetical protein